MKIPFSFNKMHANLVSSITFLLSNLLLSLTVVSMDDSNYEYSSDEVSNIDDLNPNFDCDFSKNCFRPNCSCFGYVPFGGDKQRVPQFVVLTFDDAVNTVNIKTYREILNRKKNSNGCPVTATFFVTHEYNDYEFVNELYRNGSEIAVHSITHESNTEMWRSASPKRWQDEMSGMRHILSKYSLVPSSEITGHRAPFLQTAGDATFSALMDKDFRYDSSMPSRLLDSPLWPYTLDFGYLQDCQILPCPKEKYPGLWMFPMNQWTRKSKFGNKVTEFTCSMLDACTPYPETYSDTLHYMMDNFERHYTSNKAPFPVFLHEAWLRDENRMQGFLEFFDSILQKEDVFAVSMQEVLEYLKNPVDLETYKSERRCFSNSRLQVGDCKPVTCHYKKRKIFVKSCVPCPKRYPWLANTDGAVQNQEIKTL